jgi:hypothetical protein
MGANVRFSLRDDEGCKIAFDPDAVIISTSAISQKRSLRYDSV